MSAQLKINTKQFHLNTSFRNLKIPKVTEDMLEDGVDNPWKESRQDRKRILRNFLVAKIPYSRNFFVG